MHGELVTVKISSKNITQNRIVHYNKCFDRLIGRLIYLVDSTAASCANAEFFFTTKAVTPFYDNIN
jgi:hypothetical protein